MCVNGKKKDNVKIYIIFFLLRGEGVEKKRKRFSFDSEERERDVKRNKEKDVLKNKKSERKKQREKD